jgi:hypothetical protein
MINEKSFREVSDTITRTCGRIVSIQTKHPSALEKRVRKILKHNHIKYLFQADMCKSVEGYKDLFESFYIANFYFPKKKLALELEDSPRNITDEERKFIEAAEGIRTYDLSEISRKIQVLKISKEDLDCPTFTRELLAILK